MGTITTYSHCLVKDGIAYEGTKADIVHQIAKCRFDKHNTLFVTFNYCKENQYHSYSSEMISKEIYKDVIEFIFNEAIQRGYRYYRNLNY